MAQSQILVMQLLVMYDIPDDGKRAKIADICLDFGLDRIQYSVFSGALSQTHQKALLHKLRATLGKRPGKILLLPVALDEWDKRQEVCNAAEEQAAPAKLAPAPDHDQTAADRPLLDAPNTQP